ncbi:MAG: hypothetical protein EOM69_11890, partial [Clostridia bacterium]|nr:hypothetical protein [Clostridia bacterium]
LRMCAQHLLDGMQLDRVAALLMMEDGSLNLQLELPMSIENLAHDLPTNLLPEALRVSRGVYYSADVAHEADLEPLEDYFTSRGVRALSGADIGVSVTGVAGPGGGSEDKPVGLVYIGLSTKDGDQVFERRRLRATRERVRLFASSAALDLVRKNCL